MPWLFVLADQNGADVAVLNSVTSRHVSFMMNGAGSAGFVAPPRSHAAKLLKPGLSRLKVYREFTAKERTRLGTTARRQLRFYGSLPEEAVTEDTTEGVTATFMDPLWILAERWSSPNALLTGALETYSNVDGEAILWGLVDMQNSRDGGDTFIRRGGAAIGANYSVTFDRQPVLGMMQAFANTAAGPDFNIEPVDGWADASSRVMGNLMVYPRMGEPLPHVAFRYGSKIGSNCGKMSRTYSRVVTLAQVSGTTRTTGVPIVDTYGAPGASPYGLREHFSAEADGTTATMLQIRSRGIVAAYETPRQIITITNPLPNAPAFGVDYDLGDTVTAACKSGAMEFDAQVRVHAAQIQLDQAGRENLTTTTAEI